MTYCVQLIAWYLRHFSVPWVLRRRAGCDRGCQVISGFGRHLGLTDTLGLDLTFESRHHRGFFQKPLAFLPSLWRTA